jgi:hypothetical protein
MLGMSAFIFTNWVKLKSPGCIKIGCLFCLETLCFLFFDLKVHTPHARNREQYDFQRFHSKGPEYGCRVVVKFHLFVNLPS